MGADSRPKAGQKGLIFIVSGPSGVGKSTLCGHLRAQLPQLNYSVSFTTRGAREGEIAGRDYHFIDDATFRRRIDEGYWAEWAEVHGHYYGTSARFIEGCLAAEEPVLLEIDVQGADQVIARYPDSITIFIAPPSLASLKARLGRRGSDDAETIARRMSAARQELDQHHRYRHVIVNDDLVQAKAELIDLVRAYLND